MTERRPRPLLLYREEVEGRPARQTYDEAALRVWQGYNAKFWPSRPVRYFIGKVKWTRYGPAMDTRSDVRRRAGERSGK